MPGKNNNINFFIVNFSVIFRNRSGTPTAFKMEFFVTIINDYLDFKYFKCGYHHFEGQQKFNI